MMPRRVVRSVHAFAGVPGALFLTNHYNFTDMVGVVGADIGDGWSNLFQLGLVGVLDNFLKIRQNGVQLLASNLVKVSSLLPLNFSTFSPFIWSRLRLFQNQMW